MSALAELRNAVVERGGRRVLAGVSVDVAPGEIVGLVGPNGAGKSTALRALVGYWPLESGAALIGGEPAAGLASRARARLISYLPQNRPAAWPISVEEIAALGLYAFGRRTGRLSPTETAAVEEALAAVDLSAHRKRPINTLSGGEQARAHVARALVSHAPALALDEPTGALDPYHGLGVMQALRDRADAGAGVIVALHDLALCARFCDRAILLREGEVIATGPPREALAPKFLRASYGVDAEIVDLAGGPALALTGKSSVD